MDSSSLTDEQILALKTVVERQLRYLGKLRQRMDQMSFPPGDRIHQAATEAFNGVHALHVELHYLWCARRKSAP